VVRQINRRRFLALTGTAATGGLAGCTIEAEQESSRGTGPEIALEPVIEGLTFPTNMTFLPTGNRLVCERTGQVFRQAEAGTQPQLFADLSGRMAELAGERGLLGIAHHPNFTENRRVYLRYSAPLRDGMPADYSHTAVLSSFEVAEDGSGFVPESEQHLLEIPEPGPVHNAGDLAFGPDGYLYASMGDGRRTDLGAEGWSWWYDQGQEAQNTDNLLGGILRLDVDNPSDGRPYGVPEDNPLVGQEGRNEYFAWGLRNPYRISFDEGRLFVGDVGEHVRESVYIVEQGDNCGWPITEGSSCSPPVPLGQTLGDNPLQFLNPKTWVAQTNRLSPRKVCPTPEGVTGPFTDPIVEYRRTGARFVTGGHVYRGTEAPSLQGKYIFGDGIPQVPLFATEDPGDGSKPWPIVELPVADRENDRLNGQLLSFARDPDGEVYTLSTQFEQGSGAVQKITEPA
jgi:glucose/arabinose dehydrogenase